MDPVWLVLFSNRSSTRERYFYFYPLFFNFVVKNPLLIIKHLQILERDGGSEPRTSDVRVDVTDVLVEHNREGNSQFLAKRYFSVLITSYS